MTSSARIEPLATLPVFFKLQNKTVLLIGGGEGAAWKAELLAACGANVRVIATEIDPAMHEVAAGPYGSKIEILERLWGLDDLQNVKLVIADVETEGEAWAVRCAAIGAGVSVNVVDKPDFCDFSFATIVNRSPVIVAISTDGAAPILGQELRQRFERSLPRGLGAWAKAAKDFRDRLQEMMPDKANRRQFWQAFSQVSLGTQPPANPRKALEDLAETVSARTRHASTGRVSFVGAGPGDPELLTLKAVRRLQEADVILHDALVSKEILELARREARRVPVGKRAQGETMPQAEIDALIIEEAQKVQHVVRLKGGDPAIFGRLESELAACRNGAIPFEIIPGITAASALASAAAVPLTAKNKAASLTLFSGHDFAKDEGAEAQKSLVFYMPKSASGEITERLIAQGFDEKTPCLIGVSVSTPAEQAVQTTLNRLASELRALKTDKPVIVGVGEVFRQP